MEPRFEEAVGEKVRGARRCRRPRRCGPAELHLTCRRPRRSFAAMEWMTDPQIWISLVTLTLLEIVLGIDNIVFISILSGKLPASQQRKARRLGLGLALVTRILLLIGLAWMVRLTKPLFTIWTQDVLGTRSYPPCWRPFPVGESDSRNP